MRKRTSLSLATLILVLFSFSATLKATVTIPVNQIVSRLQQQTQIPIFIPSVLPKMNRVYWGVYGANAYSYSVNFYSTPDCKGGTVCTYGRVDAERGGEFFVLDPQLAAFNPANVVEPVRLANGVQGQFANTCGFYCMAAVEWKYKGVLYHAVIKNGRKEDVLTLANSAIAAGPRTTTTVVSFAYDDIIYGREISPGLSAYLTSKEAGTPINIRDGASTRAYALNQG